MQKVAYIEDIIFMNKQNMPWAEVESYLKQYVGQKYIVEETQDVIHIGTDFPEEFSESRYTKTLRDSISKAKANAAQVIGKMVVIATNKRWVENKNEKQGWYRYDSYFAMPVQGSNEKESRVNIYKATLVIRNSLKGLFLYDIINIKKEASKPLKS